MPDHKPAPGPKPANPEQSQEFIKVASELGCDEDEAAFRDKLRVIAKQKPKDEPTKSSKSKARRG